MNGYEKDTTATVAESVNNLLSYCRKNNWAGWDPYDALNSRIFHRLSFLNSRWPRLFLTQALKRSPINFRQVLQVPKTHNPKGIALFLSSLVSLSKTGQVYGDDIEFLLELLLSLRTEDEDNFCWGYNFPWQQRISLVPKFSPNIICTTFAGNALLDYHEKYGREEVLEAALSAGHWIINNLFRKRTGGEFCFMYTIEADSEVHNANFLGCAFLARLYSVCGEKQFREFSLKAAEFSVRRQSSNGSWPYGTLKYQNWIDNFHTGYNLIALKMIAMKTDTNRFEESMDRGFQFYIKNFFDGPIPKYLNNRTYPVDIHSVAQSIITLKYFNERLINSRELPLRILQWANENMRSPEGYYFYQINPLWKNRIPFMRWSQAWMLYSLSTLSH